jgi:CRISPR-associated protein Csm2
MGMERHTSPTYGYRGGSQAREGGRNLSETGYPAIGEYAEELVRGGLRTISMSKIRRLHQEISRLRDMAMEGKSDKCRKELARLKIHLAYTYGRLEDNEKRAFREYEQTLKRTIDYILRDPQNLEDGLEKLYMFSEAVIAYHKYYGGRA